MREWALPGPPRLEGAGSGSHVDSHGGATGMDVVQSCGQSPSPRSGNQPAATMPNQGCIRCSRLPGDGAFYTLDARRSTFCTDRERLRHIRRRCSSSRPRQSELSRPHRRRPCGGRSSKPNTLQSSSQLARGTHSLGRSAASRRQRRWMNGAQLPKERRVWQGYGMMTTESRIACRSATSSAEALALVSVSMMSRMPSTSKIRNSSVSPGVVYPLKANET
jgi:hypothetical protein